MKELKYEDFFSTNKSKNSYKKELTNIIKFLLQKKRIIEAKYHFSELEKINPNHLIVMELGLEIGIKTFDREMSIKYHNLLIKNNKYNQIDLAFKRINFYLSINNIENASSSVLSLMDEINLDNGSLLKLYNLIDSELDDKILINKADEILRKKKLRLIRENKG